MAIMKYINTKEVAELFATSKQLVSHHIANILKEKELNKSSVVKQYLTTAADGKNYNDPVILRSEKASPPTPPSRAMLAPP